MTTIEKIRLLEQLGRKFGTDKIDSHDYLRHYAEHLPDKCRSMLEIGVAYGASALLWDAYFGSDQLDLYLMDLYLDPNHVSPRWAKNRGWNPIIGDQSDPQTLASIAQTFDIIIDDGSHRADHQLISFKHLFLNNLRSGGQYYIEDCNCNLEKFYWGGKVTSLFETPITMFKNFKQTGEIHNPYFNEGEQTIFTTLIANVEILSKEELILIERI